MNEPLTVDTESYVAALMAQRNGALDRCAQLEGLLGMVQKQVTELQRQNADLQRRLDELKIVPQAETLDGHAIEVPTAH
jgi:hypothetical protein